MKKLIAVCLVMSLNAYSQNNTLTFSKSSLDYNPHPKFTTIENIKPQIVRVSGKIDTQETCKEVLDALDVVFNNVITHEHFYYNFYAFCQYEENTKRAENISINNYFEPTDEQGIKILQDYKTSHQNMSFYGLDFKIEEAMGLIIALNGTFEKTRDEPETETVLLREERKTFYFSNIKEFNESLVADIYKYFYKQDRVTLIPFFKKWLGIVNERYYVQLLHRANHMELQPERIFLMPDGDKIFVSNLKYYYAKDCIKNKNHHCL